MKISLLLPYWDRQKAADEAILRLDALYPDLDLEVIVVDDGNAVQFRTPNVGLDVKVIRLPRKDEPKSPCLCWNEAAKAATGEILVLSCIEILHDKPVLGELAKAVTNGGKDAYVLASTYCPDTKEWHCHSSVHVPTCPEGSGIGFCSALHRELYFRAGGFNEEYRDGAGYEDRDFIWRLHESGAKFIKRDDLTVIHPKKGASIAWGSEKFARNLSIYESKWCNQKRVTFVCVQAGNYCDRGIEYVNTLFDMVKRNMPGGVCVQVRLPDGRDFRASS